MKRFVLSALVCSTLVLAAIVRAGTPGQELVPPTVNSHIYEDTSGNMTFSDAGNGPKTLTNLAGTSGLSAASGNLQFGSTTVAPSTATTTLGQGNVFTAFLASGSAVAASQGSVLIATSTQNGFVTVQVSTAGNGLTNVVGIAVTAASTGAVVAVYTNGWVLALTTGTVNPGDVVVSSAGAAGYLGANNSAAQNQQVGIALQQGTAAGGLCKIKLK